MPQLVFQQAFKGKVISEVLHLLGLVHFAGHSFVFGSVALVGLAFAVATGLAFIAALTGADAMLIGITSCS